jgi:hypothetical protein
MYINRVCVFFQICMLVILDKEKQVKNSVTRAINSRSLTLFRMTREKIKLMARSPPAS